MITCCCNCDPWALYLQDFLDLASEFMVYLIPASICFVILKVFVINRRTPHGDLTILRLDESSLAYSPALDPGASAWVIVLYLLTSLATFSLGVLVFETVHPFN